ncbi:MAG: tetratricopeptide repeat protein [Bacteroidaceae bacterium]|nr:tetratricopeptide repeat protein [Bacteroidaceae bacterium]
MTVMVLGVLVACSTKKNTAMTRRVQAIKAHYNSFYNGQVAYMDGVLSQEQANKDNFTEIIPLYMTSNPATAKAGKSNFDRTIEKCQKSIKQHSIVARPEWKSNKPKTQKDKIWLSQKEYNPFLYKPWFLMGESQFRQGEYMEAASTFAYIQNIYFSNPDIVAKARMLEAKCYAELEWFYDAEDLLVRAQRDSFPQNINHLKASVNADLMLRQQKYAEAIPNILTALKKEKRSLEKTRMYFLLGQLSHKVGDNANAYKYYSKVVKRNPPYELEFNARINRTECVEGAQAKQIIRNLQSMAKNSKNKEYLDQVYYAIGNVYLSQGDTTRAIWAYKDGVEKSTRNGVEKGVVLLHLGRLYWETEQFVKCQKCYADALSLFDKEKDEYDEIYDRSKILDALLPYASAVELQDSLQVLAKMDEKQRMVVIKNIIEELKKKEKEEERAKIDSEDAANSSSRNKAANNNNNNFRNNNPANRNGQAAVWYFYNPTAVEAGKKEFARKWGKRALADDWRRNNKTVLDDFNEPQDTLSNDSLANAGDLADNAADKESGNTEKDEKQEEYEKDPHRPEYYLKDIPLTPEKMEESNKALVDGLFGSAVVYKDEMENFPLAERTFNRILKDFPDFESMDEMYYNLFQLYSRLGQTDKAEEYRQKLIKEYPDNPHAILIADPDFIYKGKYGKEIEDSIYSVAYDAFVRNDYATVAENNALALKEYPNGDNRPRFMFIDALSRLEMGDRDNFMALLKEIVEKYPKSSVSELAGLYVKGLKEGRLLASGKFEMGSIWERRRSFGEDGDSLSADSLFSKEKNNEWLFAIAYERDSIDENQLLFEMAKYNFTKFTIRNFDISFDKGDGIDMLQVRTFNNYDEAYIYLHRLMNDEEMAYKLQGLKCFIISSDNLKLLMSKFSFSDYFQFYDENFDRIGHLQVDEDSLDSTTDLPDYEDEEGEYEDDGEYYDDEEEEEDY